MQDEGWVNAAQAAAVIGLTPAAVRYRLRSRGAELEEQGLARRVPAGPDGGPDRWEISLRLLREWLEQKSDHDAPPDLQQEEIDLLRRETKALELALERQRAENEALRAQNDDLRHRLEALGKQFAATVEVLAVG